MALNYKASNISKAESEYGLNFFQTLGVISTDTPSMTAVLFILRSGGATEDEADELIEKEGLVGAFKVAGEALSKSGFLAKTLNSPEVQEALNQMTSETKTSQPTGEKTKA